VTEVRGKDRGGKSNLCHATILRTALVILERLYR
jgi:hypothetical protein